MDKVPMTKEDAARIQAAGAKKEGQTETDSFAARAQVTKSWVNQSSELFTFTFMFVQAAADKNEGETQKKNWEICRYWLLNTVQHC